MNILITGGCGFIGSNFINYMVKKYPNYNFINIDTMYYCASLNNIEKCVQDSNNYSFIKGNINDMSLIKHLLTEKKISHIIHFAAQSHVDNSFEDSLQYTLDNVKGTHSLLEAVRLVNKDIFFFHFSTDEVYGESQLDEPAKNEMSLLCPTNPYAASKAAAEMYVNSYQHSYGLKCIITRGNNVYGPNQYPEKLIPKFIKLLKNNQKCTIHGKGESLRTFIHVYDVCTAVDVLLHKSKIGTIYNIGSDPHHEKSVLEVTKILIKKIHNTDNYQNYITFVEDRPFNDKRYFITNDKLKELGWTQKINFNDGLNQLLINYSCENPMKVMIVGHKGWIGQMMIKLLQNDNISYETCDTHIDNINNIKQLEKTLINGEFTHVMSFIGRTHGTITNKEYKTIDYLEEPGKLTENIRDNIFGPLGLSIICNKNNIHFTYIGTGCIFNYDKEHTIKNSNGYVEEDIPNFKGSSYSVVKGYTDQLMKLSNDNTLNLRIRMPIISKLEPRNFITKILNYEYICSIPNSMSVLDELLPYAIDMAKKNTTGTFNFTNPGTISHNDILNMYKTYVDNKFTWKNFSIEEQDQILSAKRSNNLLNTHKLESLYPNIKNIHDSVLDIILKIRDNQQQ